MRITGISTRVVDAGDRDWIFVRVDTDEAGLVGWGEASLGCHTGAVGDLRAMLVGEDPRLVERLWLAAHPGRSPHPHLALASDGGLLDW